MRRALGDTISQHGYNPRTRHLCSVLLRFGSSNSTISFVTASPGLKWQWRNGPADTRRNDIVIITLKRHDDVVLTQWWRYYYVLCPQGVTYKWNTCVRWIHKKWLYNYNKPNQTKPNRLPILCGMQYLSSKNILNTRALARSVTTQLCAIWFALFLTITAKSHTSSEFSRHYIIHRGLCF